MRKLICLLSIVCTFMAQGQMGVGIIAEPSFNFTTIGKSPQNQSDSLKNLKKKSLALSFGVEFRKQIDRYQAISIIPGYQQTNMLLVKEDLQLFDVIHPQLREIRDLAQAAQKNAYLTYRQKYIGVQVLYSKRLKARVSDSKVSFEVGGGLGGYYLFNDDVKVRTEGFAIGEDYVHIISDSTGIDVREYLVNIVGLIDVNYQLTPKVVLLSGLKASIPLTSTSTSSPKITIFNPALRVGIRFTL